MPKGEIVELILHAGFKVTVLMTEQQMAGLFFAFDGMRDGFLRTNEVEDEQLNGLEIVVRYTDILAFRYAMKEEDDEE